MGGDIGMDAIKGIRKVARKGLEEIPVVGSLIDPIMSLIWICWNVVEWAVFA